MAHEVHLENLINGRIYRVEGPGETFVGRLLMPDIPGTNPNYREFISVTAPDNIRKLHNWGPQAFIDDYRYVDVRTHRFFESGKSMVATQVARQLSKKISENAAGIVERFLVKKGRGPNRYEPRGNNENTQIEYNAEGEKVKRPRTRKNKRKSKKSRKCKN